MTTIILHFTFLNQLDHSSSSFSFLPFDDGVSNKLLCLRELSRFWRLLLRAGLGWAALMAAPADELVEVGIESWDMPPTPVPYLPVLSPS